MCTSKLASASKIERKQEWERERERATLRRKDRPQQTAKREKKELIPSILGYNSGQPKATANLSGRSELSETRRRNKIRTATMHDNTITNLISFPIVPHILSHLLAPQFLTIVYDYICCRVYYNSQKAILSLFILSLSLSLSPFEYTIVSTHSKQCNTVQSCMISCLCELRTWSNSSLLRQS